MRQLEGAQVLWDTSGAQHQLFSAYIALYVCWAGLLPASQSTRGQKKKGCDDGMFHGVRFTWGRAIWIQWNPLIFPSHLVCMHAGTISNNKLQARAGNRLHGVEVLVAEIGSQASYGSLNLKVSLLKIERYINLSTLRMQSKWAMNSAKFSIWQHQTVIAMLCVEHIF